MAENNAAIDNVITDDSAWREDIAGDNAETLEALQAFESPTALYESHTALKDKNWRDDFAGDDAEFSKQLERFESPAAFSKSFRDAQDTIRSGQHKAPGLAEGATDDDVAAYRELNGIPAEAGGYTENLPEGLVIGENDAPIVEHFMNAIHGVNAPPEVAHALIGAYNTFEEQQQNDLMEIDDGHHKESEDQLRKDWGNDYRANINLVGGLLDKTFGEETKEALLNARDPEGRGIFNIPEFMDGMAKLARQIDPIQQIVAPGGDAQQTLNDEITEIETFMRDNRAKYMKDDKMQERLRELYDIRLKHDAIKS